MEQKIIKKRNNSIDLFRLFCAVLVIIIHTNPFKGINGLEFITHQVLPRVAVPFFFIVAGFFYDKTLQKEKKFFSKYLIKILITYICWSILYFLINMFRLIVEGAFDFIPFVKSCILSFALTGSYYHFWFFPALIFSILIVAIFYKLKWLKVLYIVGIGLYLIGCLGCAYYDIALKIPLLSSLIQNPWFETIRRILLMGLPFFLLGALLNDFRNQWANIKLKTQLTVLIGLIVLFVLEIVVVVATQIYNNITLTLFLYPLVGWLFIILFNNPAEKLTKIGKISRSCAELTYYIHPALILFANWCIVSIFNIICPAWLLFIIVTCISLGIGLLWMKLDIKEKIMKISNRRKEK